MPRSRPRCYARLDAAGEPRSRPNIHACFGRRSDRITYPPTHKPFELEFCTVARWKDGEIVEEKLFYDQVGFLRQIGVI
jgi:hypothetical protein